jgi:quercetin dioxygenase-like cupin family protein
MVAPEMAAPYDIAHRDDFERTGNWLLARRSLGVSSFGINLVEIPPGETIPEHDELDRDQEEVFIVLGGTGTFIVDGEELAAPAGTYLRLDPEPRRTARNDGDEPLQLMIVSAPRTSGYEPMSWA